MYIVIDGKNGTHTHTEYVQIICDLRFYYTQLIRTTSKEVSLKPHTFVTENGIFLFILSKI